MIEDFSEKKLPDGGIELEVRVEGVAETDRIRTIEDLLARFSIDPDRYKTEKFTANSWETHFKLGDDRIFRALNYQAKAILGIRKDVVTAEKVSEIFKDLANTHAPTYKRVPRKHTRDVEGITAIMDLADLHVSMLAWGEETLGASWDSDIVVEVALEAIEDLVDRLQGMNITKFVVPMGNDILHVDGKGNMTTLGTPQDVDTRYLKMFRVAMGLMVSVIDRLRLIAPVEVVVVPGNHDRETAAYLGETIFAWYRNDPEVTVNNSASLRKYLVVGNTLVGFTHGSEEKADSLPMLMAQEKPKEWGECEFKVFHTGHLHRKRKMLSVTTDTYNGVEVLTLPSLVPPEAWHAMKGYVGGGRAAEVHLYGDESGPCGYFRHSVFNKRVE